MLARRGSGRAVSAFTRGWVFVAGATILAAVLGLAFSLAVGLSGTWIVMILGGLAIVAVLSWWPSIRQFAIAGYFLTLPMLITKAIAKGNAVYGPALQVSISDCFLLLMVIAFLIERERLPAPNVGPAPRLAGAMLLWAWLAALYGQHPADGVLAALTLSKELLGFWLVSRLVQTPGDVRRVVGAAAVGLVMQMGMAGVQFLAGRPIQFQGEKGGGLGLTLYYDPGTSAFRPFGFLLHPNILGVYLVLLLPTALALVLLGRRHMSARVWRLAIALLLAGIGLLALTLSRGSWIAFVVAAAFTLLMGWRRRLVTSRQLRLAAVLVLVIPVAIGGIYPNAWRRLTYDDARSTESRWLMIRQASAIIREHPVLGVGLSGYTLAAAQIVPPSFGEISKGYQRELAKGFVHNAYLLQWVERGLVGLALTLMTFAALLRRFFRGGVWLEPTLEAIGLGLVAGLVGQLVCNLFEHQNLDYPPGTLWPQLGLLVAIYRLQQRQNSTIVLSPASPTELVEM